MGYRMNLALCAMLPMAAHAHEGHGATSASSMLHYIAEPMHFGPVLVIAATAWWLARRKRQQS